MIHYRPELLSPFLKYPIIQLTSSNSVPYAAEEYIILVDTYGDNTPSSTTYKEWLRLFKNNDFDFGHKERYGAPSKFEKKKLEVIPYHD